MSLEAYMAERFFTPLGMAQTGYALPDARREQLANGYANGAIRRPVNDTLTSPGDNLWSVKGGNGMQTSVNDIYRWHSALRAGTTINASVRRDLFAPQYRRPDGVNSGYGWLIRSDPGGTVIQINNSGSDGAFVSGWLWQPTQRLFVFFLSNSGDNQVTQSLMSTMLRLLAS